MKHEIDKNLLAMHTISEYSGLTDVLGHTRAADEMGQVLEQYVVAGELNQFEADLIHTVAVLGHIATYVMNENERLRNE